MQILNGWMFLSTLLLLSLFSFVYLSFVFFSCFFQNIFIFPFHNLYIVFDDLLCTCFWSHPFQWAAQELQRGHGLRESHPHHLELGLCGPNLHPLEGAAPSSAGFWTEYARVLAQCPDIYFSEHNVGFQKKWT
jgi:hypothetical protein